jgi:excisionase family DNA binding protein
MAIAEDQPAFLTAPEVAAILRLPVSAVYLAVKRGELKSRRFGKHVRIPRSAVLGDGQ